MSSNEENKDIEIKDYKRTDNYVDENPGRVSATINDPIEMPVAFLIGVPGLRAEHTRLHFDMPKIKKLSELVQDESFRKNHPVELEVQHDGEIYVTDGNHRIRAAFLAGLESYPCKWKFYGSSEDKLHPQDIIDEYSEKPKSNAGKLKHFVQQLKQKYAMDKKTYLFEGETADFLKKLASEYDNVGGNTGYATCDQEWSNDTTQGLDYGGENDPNKNDNYIGGRDKPPKDEADATNIGASSTFNTIDTCFDEAKSGRSENMKQRLNKDTRAEYEVRLRNLLANKKAVVAEKETPLEEAAHLDNPVMHKVEDVEHLLGTIPDEKLMHTVHELEKETADDLGLPDQGIVDSDNSDKKEDNMTDKHDSHDKLEALLSLSKEERIQKAANLQALAAMILAADKDDEKENSFPFVKKDEEKGEDKSDKKDEDKSEKIDKKEVEAAFGGSAEEDEKEAKDEAKADEAKEDKKESKEEKTVEAALSAIVASINELREDIKAVKASQEIKDDHDQIQKAKEEGEQHLPDSEVEAIVPQSPITASEKEEDKSDDKKDEDKKEDEEMPEAKIASMKEKFNNLMNKKAANDFGGNHITDKGEENPEVYLESTPSETKESKSSEASVDAPEKISLDAVKPIEPSSPKDDFDNAGGTHQNAKEVANMQALASEDITNRVSRAFDLSYRMMQAGQIKHDSELRNKIAEFSAMNDIEFNAISNFVEKNLKPIASEDVKENKQDDKPDFKEEKEEDKSDKEEIPEPKPVRKASLASGLKTTIVAGVRDIAENKTTMAGSNMNKSDIKAKLEAMGNSIFQKQANETIEKAERYIKSQQ